MRWLYFCLRTFAGDAWARQDGTGLRGFWLDGNRQGQVAGPAIGGDLPIAVFLTGVNEEIFAALLAAFAHGGRDQHLAAAGVEGKVANHLHAESF